LAPQKPTVAVLIKCDEESEIVEVRKTDIIASRAITRRLMGCVMRTIRAFVA